MRFILAPLLILVPLSVFGAALASDSWRSFWRNLPLALAFFGGFFVVLSCVALAIFILGGAK